MTTSTRTSQAGAGTTERNPSASPPPSRPTTLSPGIRASALQKLYNDALSHTLRSCPYNNFAACFPTPAKHVPESLDGLHRDFVGKLERMGKAEFQTLMEEQNVVPSLNELDNLIADAKKRMERTGQEEGQKEPPTPPHLLPPDALLAAHMKPFLAGQTESLGAQLESAQSGNRELAAEIAEQRQTIELLVGGLENVVKDLEAAAEVMQGQEMSGIEADLERAATTA